MPERCVVWISADVADTDAKRADDQRACIRFAESKEMIVSQVVFGSAQSEHQAYGQLHELLRRHDACVVVVPASDHIHLGSASRLAGVYAARTAEYWRWGRSGGGECHR